jgi:replicative DNA helicase
MSEQPIFEDCALETHFSDFDNLTGGLQPSDLIVIAGRPSNGKTALAMNIAVNIAVRDQKVVGVFSTEMSTQALFIRMMCSQAYVDSNLLRSGFVRKEDFEKLVLELGSLADAPIFIDETSPISVSEMRTKCRLLRQKHGRLDLIVVDCLQYVNADIGGMYSSGTELEELSASVRSLKVLAREFACPVLTTCQIDRGGMGVRKRPTLADLSKCGSVEQDADVVAVVFREDLYFPDDPEQYGKAELIIAKQRNGPTGVVKLAFIKQATRFVNLAHESGGGEY